MKKRGRMRTFLKLDWILLTAVLLLLGIGLLALYSISSSGWQGGGFFVRQCIYASVGFFLLFFLASVDYRHIQRYSTPLYFATLGVLAAVLLWGSTVRGTAGWIKFGLFQVQPVEVAKLTLIIFLASFISKKRTELGELVRLAASFVLAFVLIALVLKQPDLGSSLVLTAVWAGMLFVSGMRMKHFLFLVLAGVAVAASSWFFLAPYQKERIMTVFEPQADPRGSGYNVMQAIVAVGSGGLKGKGIGHGSQSQLNFLPEKHTDFIFSVITEELGLVGSFLVLFLYGLLFYRTRVIASEARDNFGYLLTAGVMIMLFVQIAVNVGMNIGVVPVTGIPLPLLSYGGSSLVTVMASLGLVLGVALRRDANAGLRLPPLS
jgi:rod shape determining protein RodA